MAFCNLCWVEELVGRSRIRRAAISYFAKESMSRLRTLDASAICTEVGGRLGSLGICQLRNILMFILKPTVMQQGASGIWEGEDGCPFQIGQGSHMP